MEFHDITLRDGEQLSGLCSRKNDKLRIAEALAEAWVDRIEAGMPVASSEDAVGIKAIVSRAIGRKRRR